MNNKSLPGIRYLQNGAGLIFADHRELRGSLLDSKLGSIYFCAHTGTSMYPTLCESDILEIEAYGDKPIFIGDVIFFLPPQGGQPVVHRVIRISFEGIRTKGDSNNRLDQWVLRTEDVFGRVVGAAHGNQRRPIYGGNAGRLWAFGLRCLKVVEKSFSFLYHHLAKSRLLRRLVPIQKWMRIVVIKRPSGKAYKLLLGKLMIGNYQPGMNYWKIRRPFRLFVDVTSLPK